MKFNYILCLVSFIALVGCSKSDNIENIRVSGNPFHSEELSNNFDKHLPVRSLENFNFDHYLVVYRFKTFGNPEDAFTKIVYGESMQSGLELRVKETEISSLNNVVSYTFSNDWFPVFIDGGEAEKLSDNVFTDIPFSFKVDNEIEYEGVFPEPGSLSDLEETNIGNISKSTGELLNWSPSIHPNGKVKIVIVHLSTTGEELQPIKEFIADDTGSFDLGASKLLAYESGDEISISLIRDIYLQQDNILIRGVEEQAWSFVKIEG